MGLPPFFVVILIIVIISAVVGAVAKMVNNQNEQNANPNAARARPPAPAGGGDGGVRTGNSDMDRFLAEIDRLRRKTAEAPPPPPNQAPAVPVVQPAKQADRPRTRVVAELAEPQPQQQTPTRQQDLGFNSPPSQIAEVPTAAPVAAPPPSGTGAPATRVTRLATRARPVAKTPFAKNLTTLLNSGQGLALAIVLQEILGPAKSKKE